MVKKRVFRLVSDLSPHECEELEGDFDIDLKGKHVVVALTREQWIVLVGVEHADKIEF